MHVITPLVDNKSMEFEQEPLMINFIRDLAEIHDYDVSLASLVKGVIQTLCELNKSDQGLHCLSLIQQVLRLKTGNKLNIFKFRSTHVL